MVTCQNCFTMRLVTNKNDDNQRSKQFGAFELSHFAIAAIPIDEPELGRGCHDLAGLKGVIRFGIYIITDLHLPRCRFSLYLEVWMLRFIHCSRLMVGDVMMSLEKILEFSSSISFMRMLRFSEEQVFRFRTTSVSSLPPREGACLTWLILIILRIMLWLSWSMTFFCRRLRGAEGECLGLSWLCVSNLLLAVSILSRCFFCAYVRSMIERRSLLPLRFQELECIQNMEQQAEFALYFDKIYHMSEEQEKIQKYIIKNTPYGELNEVIRDLEKLAPLNLASPHIATAIEQYNEQHLALFPLKNSPQQNFALMACSKIDNGRYLDQANKRIYTVDHLRGQIIAVEETAVELVDSVEELLTHLTAASTKYAETYYKEPFGSHVFMDLTEEALDVYVGITSKNVQLGNFYTGEWVSKWKITKGSIEGSISIKSHFFQSGNVQFNQKKNVKSDFQFTENMAENAKNIIKIIEKLEGEVQAALSQLYEEMPVGFFKNLRRVTPVTKTKMVWNINSIKMNKNLLGMNK